MSYNTIGDNMDKLTNFKEFVKKNPSLIKFVKNNEMTWQKFYELYDLYGEDDSVWSSYKNNNSVESTAATTAGVLGMADIFDWLKNINLDSFQDGISSIQRVISVLQDLGNKDTNVKPEYTPRPLYKHFED